MKVFLVCLAIITTSVNTFAGVNVCGEVTSAPTAGRVYGDSLITVGEVSYYLPYDVSESPIIGQTACVSGELNLIKDTVIPITQLQNISRIVVVDTSAQPSVTVCGELASAPTAGRVHGDNLISSGGVSYYLPIAVESLMIGKVACISGELNLVEDTDIPISQFNKVTNFFTF